MNKIRNGKIKLSDIKFTENSRLRGKDDVSDLMQDIEQHGLLEPIGVRDEDNSLIFGNRRVKAFEKLGYEEIDCQFFDGVDDGSLLILNVIENIKRKSIGSIEIGRMCQMLEKQGLTRMEIATRLGIKVDRVRACISAYEVTKGTPFEQLIEFHSGRGRAHNNIPEGIIWKVQTCLNRAFIKNKLTKEHWKILLPAIESGKITSKNIFSLRSILIQDPEKNLGKALDILDKVKIVNLFIPLNEEELRKMMSEEKYESASEFIRNIIKQYNKNLLF